MNHVRKFNSIFDVPFHNIFLIPLDVVFYKKYKFLFYLIWWVILFGILFYGFSCDLSGDECD